MKPYLQKKAENYATHEDIQKLVDQVRETERLKADIADQMWDRQAKWKFRADHYGILVADLAKMNSGLSELRSFMDPENQAGKAQSETIMTHVELMSKHVEDVAQHITSAGLFASPDAIQAFTKAYYAHIAVLDSMHRNLLPDAETRAKEFNSAFASFVMLARKDLNL